MPSRAEVPVTASTAQAIVDRLAEWGAERVFGIPGDGCNGLVEALRRRRSDIDFVLVPHEECAALAAAAHARLTGRLGVCLATGGPGAIHLLNGLYDARLDGAPVVALTGQVGSAALGTRDQQEVATVPLLADVARCNLQVTGPRHAAAAVDAACRTALASRTVSHLSVPKDVQQEPQRGRSPPAPSWTRSVSRPADEALSEAARLVDGMRRPLVVVGRGCREAQQGVAQLSERLAAPVAKALLGKDVLADTHPNCLGGIGTLGSDAAAWAARRCDGLLLVGSSSPYLVGLLGRRDVPVVQVDDEPARIGARVRTQVGLLGDAAETLDALVPRLRAAPRHSWLHSCQAERREWERRLAVEREAEPAGVAATLAAVADGLADDAVVACDTGNVTVWAARHVRARAGQRFLFSGTLSTLGCALPYALAAQAIDPERQVVALLGDGALAMSMGTLPYLAKGNVKVVVVSDGRLGMVEREQEDLGHSPYGTALPSMDVVRLGEALGFSARRIRAADGAEDTVREALASRRPVLLECPARPRIDPHEAARLARRTLRRPEPPLPAQAARPPAPRRRLRRARMERTA